MRSMWKGAISFGLVTIPVKLYAATESKDVRFNLLHAACKTPVQYRKWCATCDREVAGEEVVKGYEFERGRYVVVAEEEMAALPVAAARTLEIVDFVKLEQIDPVYYEKSYYLEPGEGGAKAYALLRRAMETTGRIAIARVVIRSKESLAAIRVFQNGVLALQTMHFPDEVRSPAGLTGIIEPELRQQELEMATNLIASMAGEFTPEKFQNEYREALLELIDAKAQGEVVETVAAAPERGRVVDLMEALRASIRQAEAERGEVAVGPAAAAPPVPGVPAAVPGVPAGFVAGGGGAAASVPGIPGVPGAPGPAPGAPLVPGAVPVPAGALSVPPGTMTAAPPGGPHPPH